MSLENLSHEERILFLQRFAAEIVMNAAHNEWLKQKIKAEKIKMKYLEEEKEVSAEDFGTLGIFHEQQVNEKDLRKPNKLMKKRKDKKIFYIDKPPKKIDRMPTIASRKGTSSVRDFSGGNRVQGVSSGAYRQIENFLRDPAVQLIECSGPGKNVVLKVRNNINMTKLVLNQQGIEEIITNYANQAGVPVIGGVLKAAVGDLIISAVISEFVGSRFIISRKSPYSMIG